MIERFADYTPLVHPTAWIHPTAVVIGEVTIGPRVSVWPGAVIRGDQGPIVIEEDSNVQDHAMIHNTGGWSVTRIGARVTIGHRAILHGCTIEPDCLIGMGAIVLDNVVVEQESIIGAAALVSAGKRIPRGSMVMGTPGRVVRSLGEKDLAMIDHGWREYVRLVELIQGKE